MIVLNPVCMSALYLFASVASDDAPMRDWKVIGGDNMAYYYVDVGGVSQKQIDVDHPNAVVISELVDEKVDVDGEHARSTVSTFAFNCSTAFGKQLKRTDFIGHMGMGVATSGPQRAGRRHVDWHEVTSGTEEAVLMKIACAQFKAAARPES